LGVRRRRRGGVGPWVMHHFGCGRRPVFSENILELCGLNPQKLAKEKKEKTKKEK
jgi:hypothetical protein